MIKFTNLLRIPLFLGCSTLILHSQVWNDVVEQENANQLSPWYGEFWASSLDAGWIHHVEHSWQFALGSSPTDVYLFDQKLDTWLNTNSAMYPVFYDFDREEFIQYDLGTKDPRIFLGLSSGQVFDDGLVRAPISDVEFMKALTFPDQARIAIYFRLLGISGNPVASPGVNNYTLLENGFALNPSESLQRVTEEPDSIKNYSLLAIDLSGSIRITPGALSNLVEAAKDYVESVMADGTHTIGIAYFANELVLIDDGFTDNKATALARLEQLETVIPDDTTTNLHGAFLNGAQRLNELDQVIEDLLIRSLVVFTDGQDQAGINSAAEVSSLIASEDAKDNGISFFTIGTGPGVDFTLLESFGTSGFWKADTLQDVGPAFDAVAASVSKKGEGVVLVEYESPKRNGIVSVEVILNDDGNSFSWFLDFDAFGFKSPLPKIDIASLPKMLLVDSGVRVNFQIASPLYDQFDHAMRIDFDGNTDFGGFSKERPVNNQTVDFPMEAIFPGRERTIFNNSQIYLPAKVRVTVKTKDGIIFKQSDPADLQLGEVQSLPIQPDAVVSHDTYTIFYGYLDYLSEYDRSMLESRLIAKAHGGWQYASNSYWIYFSTIDSKDVLDTNDRSDLYRFNYLSGETEFIPIPPELFESPDHAVILIDVGTDARFVLLKLYSPTNQSNTKYYVYDSIEQVFEMVNSTGSPTAIRTALGISNDGRYIAFHRYNIENDKLIFATRYDRQLDILEDATVPARYSNDYNPRGPLEMDPGGDYIVSSFVRNDISGIEELAVFSYKSLPYLNVAGSRAKAGAHYHITPNGEYAIYMSENLQGNIFFSYGFIDPEEITGYIPTLPLGSRPYKTPWVLHPLSSSYNMTATLIWTRFDLREPSGQMDLGKAPLINGYTGDYQLIKYKSRMTTE